mmetsp:Transcript_4327/g.7908  ORF Transcript_4327/g.7908 Transcript_4327/m.7908 type:complete len:844 (+) Transcript_4327:364-2895(+)
MDQDLSFGNGDGGLASPAHLPLGGRDGLSDGDIMESLTSVWSFERGTLGMTESLVSLPENPEPTSNSNEKQKEDAAAATAAGVVVVVPTSELDQAILRSNDKKVSDVSKLISMVSGSEESFVLSDVTDSVSKPSNNESIVQAERPEEIASPLSGLTASQKHQVSLLTNFALFRKKKNGNQEAIKPQATSFPEVSADERVRLSREEDAASENGSVVLDTQPLEFGEFLADLQYLAPLPTSQQENDLLTKRAGSGEYIFPWLSKKAFGTDMSADLEDSPLDSKSRVSDNDGPKSRALFPSLSGLKKRPSILETIRNFKRSISFSVEEKSGMDHVGKRQRTKAVDAARQSLGDDSFMPGGSLDTVVLEEELNSLSMYNIGSDEAPTASSGVHDQTVTPKATSSSRGMGYAELPDEILCLIFANLSHDDLFTASLVCKSWRASSMNEAHWEKLCASVYNRREKGLFIHAGWRSLFHDIHGPMRENGDAWARMSLPKRGSDQSGSDRLETLKPSREYALVPLASDLVNPLPPWLLAAPSRDVENRVLFPAADGASRLPIFMLPPRAMETNPLEASSPSPSSSPFSTSMETLFPSIYGSRSLDIPASRGNMIVPLVPQPRLHAARIFVGYSFLIEGYKSKGKLMSIILQSGGRLVRNVTQATHLVASHYCAVAAMRTASESGSPEGSYSVVERGVTKDGIPLYGPSFVERGPIGVTMEWVFGCHYFDKITDPQSSVLYEPWPACGTIRDFFLKKIRVCLAGFQGREEFELKKILARVYGSDERVLKLGNDMCRATHIIVRSPDDVPKLFEMYPGELTAHVVSKDWLEDSVREWTVKDAGAYELAPTPQA